MANGYQPAPISLPFQVGGESLPYFSRWDARMSIVCVQWSPHFQDIVLDDCFGFGGLAFINDEPFLYHDLNKIQYKLVEFYWFFHVEEMPRPIDDLLCSVWNLCT